MSLMQQRDKVIAVLCSDIHLQAKPPKCRRKEPDWFEAMYRVLAQLRTAAEHYQVPILCAGDVFDHWRAEPQLINFAINHLPEMYAIPGQHDLPLHNLELIQRSAFWTLVLAGKIHYVPMNEPVMAENKIVLHGFPWGHSLKPLPEEERTKNYHVALVHDYFWQEGHSYSVASKDNHSSRYRERVSGYHAVAFGDNHKGFLTQLGGVPVLNCGGMMRRATDEKDYQPSVGLLCRSGQIIIHPITTAADKFEEKEEEKGYRRKMGRTDLENFLYGLDELEHKHFDYIMAMEYALESRQVDNKVRRIILQALGRD